MINMGFKQQNVISRILCIKGGEKKKRVMNHIEHIRSPLDILMVPCVYYLMKRSKL